MTRPTMYFLTDQSFPIADSYWMCGEDNLLNELPERWVGLCTLVRLKMPMTVVYSGIEAIVPEKQARSKRSPIGDNEVYLDVIGQPRGIPIEFKARDEVMAGVESIIPWITINKNVEWINYVYYNQQRIFNYTLEGFEVFGAQLHATSTMTRQNRQALDWLLAQQGGVCYMFGEECCTYIPENTAQNGSFTRAMNKMKKLQAEMSRNAGNDARVWPGLERLLGEWGALCVKVVAIVFIVIVVVLALQCCIAPILKRWIQKMWYKRGVEATKLQMMQTGMIA